MHSKKGTFLLEEKPFGTFYRYLFAVRLKKY